MSIYPAFATCLGNRVPTAARNAVASFVRAATGTADFLGVPRGLVPAAP